MFIKKTTIMTIRHGETEFNRQRRYAGLLDISLNANGINDCRSVSRYFVESVEAVITSKLKRSIETARILTENSTPIIESALCNERNFGAMQGHTSQEVEFIKPEIRYVKIGGDFHSLNPPQGERFPALRRRAKEFFEFLEGLLSAHEYTRVLVVSHEVFLQQFHGVLRRETWRESMRHSLPNLTLSTFILQGSHLRSESSVKLTSEAQHSWHIAGTTQISSIKRQPKESHRFRETRSGGAGLREHRADPRQTVLQKG